MRKFFLYVHNIIIMGRKQLYTLLKKLTIVSGGVDKHYYYLLRATCVWQSTRKVFS